MIASMRLGSVRSRISDNGLVLVTAAPQGGEFAAVEVRGSGNELCSAGLAGVALSSGFEIS